MSGKNAIIDKIRLDAQIKANSTLEEGNQKAQQAIDIANSDAVIYKEKNMAESYLERDEIIKRKITVANLESKKLVLQAKKTVIDKAFNEAVKVIKGDKKGYLSLIERMTAFCENGDTVVISREDKGVITKEFIHECAKKQGKTVKISDEYGDFCGGIILTSDNADKNLTLDSELAEIRRENEVDIAKILFGE